MCASCRAQSSGNGKTLKCRDTPWNLVNNVPLSSLPRSFHRSRPLSPVSRARYVDIIAAETRYRRGHPKTTMEALR